MNRKKHLFYDKIQCIYHSIAKKNLDNFSKLFYIEGNKATFENRKIYLRKKWINKQEKPVNPRMFKSEYFQYPFSQLTVNGRRLFDNASEFLEMDIEPFCQRIKSYTNLQVELKIDEDTHYKYMYVFNINGVEDNPNIDYYEIEYLSSDIPNEISVSVKPPKHKSSLEIQPYRGTLKYQGNKIILTFENADDYISAIFNTDLINNHSKYLVGVGVGIADINQKIPVAKKVILTKEQIEDVDEIYLLLNETELISAQENSYSFKHNDKNPDPTHLEKYIKKISRMNLLFEKLSKQQKYSSFYEQLAFKEFSATTNIFEKLQDNHPYFVNYRKRVLDILLKSYPQEQYKSIYIVMPIYQEDNLFSHLSPKALLLQKELQELSSQVKVEIIFILKNCQEPFTYEFRAFLEKVHGQIELRFAFKSQIEHEVNSIDFLFTDKHNFVVSKFLRVNNPVFNISQDQMIMDEHEAMYQKIVNRSVGYNAFMEDGSQLCSNINPLLKTLAGEWYFYLYGSRKLWEDRVVIFEDGGVDFYSDNQKTDSGLIINKEYQSVILLDDIVSRRLLTIVFDHQAYKIQKAFSVKVISKQYNNDLDILTIGIFSRKPIEMMKVYEILGDIDDVRILENSAINDNLANYLIDEYGYHHAHESYAN